MIVKLKSAPAIFAHIFKKVHLFKHLEISMQWKYTLNKGVWKGKPCPKPILLVEPLLGSVFKNTTLFRLFCRINLQKTYLQLSLYIKLEY